MDAVQLKGLGDAAVGGIPLVAVILGLVQLLKLTGLDGQKLRLVSMAVGVVLGGGYMLTMTSPVGFGGWFGIVVYGLAMGLVASGIYDVGGQWAQKASGRATCACDKIEEQ